MYGKPLSGLKYISIIIKGDKKDFSILHLNIASLSLHKEEFENGLTLLNFDISLLGYNYFSIQTESEKGDVMLYIAKDHKCNPREDLSSIVYKSYELESVFMEIIVPNKKILQSDGYIDILECT